MLPAVSTLTGTNIELEQRIFDSFVEAAASEAVTSGNSRWVAESFEALELNRAASLRESTVLADVWRRKLPAEYWDVLGQLRAEEARGIRSQSRSEQEKSLKLKLTELEAEVGLRFSNNEDENFRPQASLIHFQHGLSSSEILLSYYLGHEHSYLWAVTRESVRLYSLGPAGGIREDAAAFREAVRGNRGDARASGSKLYRELFGRLSRDESGKRRSGCGLSAGRLSFECVFDPRGGLDELARAIDELAADSGGGAAAGQLAERIARLWGMISDLDPGARQAPLGYERPTDE